VNFKMSQNKQYDTRSRGPSSVDGESTSKQKSSDKREKSVDAIDAKSLIQVLSQIQDELSQLSKLPKQINVLEQRLNEVSRAPSVIDEYSHAPAQDEIPISLPALKLKDVASNIPTYNGYKISVFQFSRACERARDLLPSVQEPQLV
jgi:hypothetical protein